MDVEQMPTNTVEKYCNSDLELSIHINKSVLFILNHTDIKLIDVLFKLDKTKKRFASLEDITNPFIMVVHSMRNCPLFFIR